MDIIYGSKENLSVTEVDSEHAEKTKKRIVFSPENVWEDHVMRIFTMEKGGKTYQHAHEWPHWVFTLSGEGRVITEEENYELSKGNYIFIPGNLSHNLENIGDEEFEFMCIVPREGDTF
ncbi:MAG: cupin domain-containing protein [bacterium]